MSASGAGETATGIGPVDALVDAARGPCVDSVAVRGEIASALLGLAGAVGEPMPKAGHWLGVERQMEALARIEAGLVRILEEVRGKVHERVERGLKRLRWRAQVARRAVRDMVRGTLVRDEWVDGARLDRVYGGIVGAWRRVSFWLGKCDAVEAVLRGVATLVPRHVRGVVGEGGVRDAGGVEVRKGTKSARTMLSVAGRRLSKNGEDDIADAAGQVAGMAEALDKLGSLGVPEMEVVEGDGVGDSVDVGVSGSGRAFLRGDGGGIVVEWRSEFRVPVWLGEEGEGEWAAKCGKEVGDAASGLVLGQRLNAWAESEGCALPVQALRGVAVRVEQGWGNDSDPLGAWTCLMLQVAVGVGVPVADVVGNEAWEDVEGKLRAGVARECLDVLSTCEESGAGYAGSGVLGALVVEGGCGVGGGVDGMAGDVLRGVASVRLCALRVGQVVGQGGCGEWSDALKEVVGLEREGGADCGTDGVWDTVAECGGGQARSLWESMREWRVSVMVSGDIGKAGRCSRFAAVKGKVMQVISQGCGGHDSVDVWGSSVDTSDVVEKVVKNMKVWAENSVGAWCGKREAADVESMHREAETGTTLVTAELGRMYETGKGVQVDLAEAARLFEAAAEQGHADAHYRLGCMYFEGKGVRINFAAAARHFEAAAEQGHADAQYRLGCMYFEGKDVRISFAKAKKWLEAAVEQGYVDAQNRLGCMYFEGKNYAEAARRFEAAAEQGDVDAQFRLGRMFETGRGVHIDFAKAAQRFKTAAEQGHADAQFRLGCMCFEGKGMTKNIGESMRWIRAAAEQGHAGAQFRLGLQYAEGRVVSRSRGEAVRWLKAAAEQGNADARDRLQNT